MALLRLFIKDSDLAEVADQRLLSVLAEDTLGLAFVYVYAYFHVVEARNSFDNSTCHASPYFTAKTGPEIPVL